MKIHTSHTVTRAVDAGAPIVALESTIIAHGFPRPANLAVAQALEAEVVALGAVPATIALLDGIPYVGLEPEQLVRVAEDPAMTKASLRDLAACAAHGISAATTVAATAHLARAVGIRTFATGGIGGVHRGGAVSLDISADLRALGHTPIAVVSAGAKAILDLGLTLEVLESESVPVVGYRCERFPSFYARASPHPVPHRVENVETLASLCTSHWAMGLRQAVLVCNPIDPAFEIPSDQVEMWIASAIEQADSAGVSGKRLTPFLLERLLDLSEGRTLLANRALALGNARLAAELAIALATGDHSAQK